MTLKIAKVGLALALTLTNLISSNLSEPGAQIEPPTQKGYYYFPPHQLKTFEQLTPQQQKKAAELKFDRAAFAKYLVNSNPNTPTWGEAMGYTQPKK